MNIDKIIKEMTLEEKAALCSGGDFWHTKENKRLDIPKIMVSDGPHGLRKNVENSNNPNESIKSVCFPSACTTACSFDRNLLKTMGKALGIACKAEDVAVLLGPGCNIKRTPLCGRNFEYFSEDPYLSSQMAAAHINGVQSVGTGTSLKHFACNNQETRRMSCSVNVDERTFREIYAASFEGAVKEGKPYTVMCSYNRINDVYSSDNEYLLTKLLREEWGFDGLVVSDWGAVNNRAEAIKAGLDLEMPTSYGINDRLIVESVNNGTLSEKDLDKAVRNILNLIQKHEDAYDGTAKWDMESQHELARMISSECSVLLKNDDKILPLSVKNKIAFIGAFADKPRYQGGGSSHINAFKVTSALEAVKEYCDVEYAQGYRTDTDEIDEELETQAVNCAKECDTVVIFAGLTDLYESEGFDRKHMRLPECQLQLIDKISKINSNIVVVLHNGSPVELPFLNNIKGLLEVYLGGQAVGGATCDLFFGKVNPSGKLAETFPEKLSDNPSYLSFPGEKDKVCYSEGIFVGYRYYDYKEIQPMFPFGYGLSYTDFEYSKLKVSTNELADDETLIVSLNVTNIGKVEGKEVVELYITDKECSVPRPIRELKGFEKVSLKSGETKKVVFQLEKRAFAFYSDIAHKWFVEDGEFIISVGSSSKDIRLCEKIHVSSNDVMLVHFTLNSTFSDILSTDEGKELFKDYFGKLFTGMGDNGNTSLGESSQKMQEAMLSDMPLRALVSFSVNSDITLGKLQTMVDNLNDIINVQEK